MENRITFVCFILCFLFFEKSLCIHHQSLSENSTSGNIIYTETKRRLPEDENEKFAAHKRNPDLPGNLFNGLEYKKRPLEIRVAMKDESDTTLMKGEEKPIVYRMIACRTLVGYNLTLTFGVDDRIVNLTNLDSMHQITVPINKRISNFTVFLKALNVGKTNVDIIGIYKTDQGTLEPDMNTTEGISNAKLDVDAIDELKYYPPSNVDRSLYDINNSTITVSIYKSEDVKILSDAFGWMYFFSWVVIFYPQIYGNWKTKSVVGVNFDFLAIVLVDLSLYTVYMLGLYCSREIQHEYKVKLDTEVIPVKINDVIFGVLTVCSSLVVIAQCKFYKTGGQQVSRTCKILLGAIFVFLLVIIVITLLSNTLQWIDFLTYISFVKIFTATKYVPQVYMNFQRRSTAGFSIGLVICDVNGGLFSILQMIADSYNFDDWSSFSGNPTKFIVGVFTLVFDAVLIIQHYSCYKHSHPWEAIPSSDEDNDENSNNVTTPNV